MKNVTTFSMAALAVVAMLCIGMTGINQNLSFGPFFIFIGICTAIGLIVDITSHISNRVKTQIRKSNIRKLQP